MVLVLSYSKNKRDFENEINGSKTDPGQMSQDFFMSPLRVRGGCMY